MWKMKAVFDSKSKASEVLLILHVRMNKLKVEGHNVITDINTRGKTLTCVAHSSTRMKKIVDTFLIWDAVKIEVNYTPVGE